MFFPHTEEKVRQWITLKHIHPNNLATKKAKTLYLLIHKRILPCQTTRPISHSLFPAGGPEGPQGKYKSGNHDQPLLRIPLEHMVNTAQVQHAGKEIPGRRKKQRRNQQVLKYLSRCLQICRLFWHMWRATTFFWYQRPSLKYELLNICSVSQPSPPSRWVAGIPRDSSSIAGPS